MINNDNDEREHEHERNKSDMPSNIKEHFKQNIVEIIQFDK